MDDKLIYIQINIDKYSMTALIVLMREKIISKANKKKDLNMTLKSFSQIKSKFKIDCLNYCLELFVLDM